MISINNDFSNKDEVKAHLKKNDPLSAFSFALQIQEQKIRDFALHDISKFYLDCHQWLSSGKIIRLMSRGGAKDVALSQLYSERLKSVSWSSQEDVSTFFRKVETWTGQMEGLSTIQCVFNHFIWSFLDAIPLETTAEYISLIKSPDIQKKMDSLLIQAWVSEKEYHIAVQHAFQRRKESNLFSQIFQALRKDGKNGLVRRIQRPPFNLRPYSGSTCISKRKKTKSYKIWKKTKKVIWYKVCGKTVFSAMVENSVVLGFYGRSSKKENRRCSSRKKRRDESQLERSRKYYLYSNTSSTSD